MTGDFFNEKWKEYRREEWQDNEVYLVSNYGRFRTLRHGKDKPKDVKLSNLNGYKTVCAKCKDSKWRNFYAHRIVAEVFVTKQSKQTQVLHLDYTKDNNQSRNLRWATTKEQQEHLLKSPEYVNSIKNKRTNAKLTESQVKLLKRKLNDPNRKTRYKILAKQFGITEMQLHRIKTGENWGNVDPY